jgi:hypothetical protein
MLFARDGDPIKWKMESALESAGVEFTNGTARGEAEGG